jgi:NAD(P)-dependent dehydrogenase (short-subunit alcohol dehydrogenase family)
MTGELAGRVALVTGASRGLGFAIAETFAAEGARVALIDLKPAWAQAAADRIAAQGGTTFGIGADVGDRAAVDVAFAQVAARFGGLDIVVNNAMWNRYDMIPDITPETMQKMLSVGFAGVVWGIQAGAALMRDRGGSIINIGSMAGRLGSPGALLYGGIKAGVDGMTRSASIELGPDRIRVNTIAPATIATEGVMAILDDNAIADRKARSPLKRLGETSDIAQAALWLASDRSSFVTGQSLAVDGGIGHSFIR